jgi:ATP-dependent DNA ligase
MELPVNPPILPMLAKRVSELPKAGAWIFEPKWDGFRALIFRDGKEVFIQSRDEKPLNRYFPELIDPILKQLPTRCVLDGEIVIAQKGALDFDSLQLRLHPAASRVKLLSEQIPASMHLTPATSDFDLASDWFRRFEGAGLDGVVAKPVAGTYESNKRVMLKVKHERDCDCVVAGFRWHKKGDRDRIGSLLLGLYNDTGNLQHVGVCASFTDQKRIELVEFLKPYRKNALVDHPWKEWAGDDLRIPGAQSRWSAGKDLTWEPLRPELVIEVAYDHMQGDRFRHTAQFRRWRSDKKPSDCTFAQLEVVPPHEIELIFKTK